MRTWKPILNFLLRNTIHWSRILSHQLIASSFFFLLIHQDQARLTWNNSNFFPRQMEDLKLYKHYRKCAHRGVGIFEREKNINVNKRRKKNIFIHHFSFECQGPSESVECHLLYITRNEWFILIAKGSFVSVKDFEEGWTGSCRNFNAWTSRAPLFSIHTCKI